MLCEILRDSILGFCGCGIRSLRYLKESEADFVAANDGNECYGSIIVENLNRVCAEEEKRWVVSHLEANRVMTEYYLQKSLFDFIDVDSFGSDSSFLRSAINCLKFGGLLGLCEREEKEENPKLKNKGAESRD